MQEVPETRSLENFLLDGAPVIGPIVIRIGLRGNPAALLGTLTKAAGCYYLLRPCTVINGHLSLRQGNQTNPWHFGQVRNLPKLRFQAGSDCHRLQDSERPQMSRRKI